MAVFSIVFDCQLINKSKEKALMQAREIRGCSHAWTCLWLWKCTCCSVEVTPHRATPQPQLHCGNNSVQPNIQLSFMLKLWKMKLVQLQPETYSILIVWDIKYNGLRWEQPLLAFTCILLNLCCPTFHKWHQDPLKKIKGRVLSLQFILQALKNYRRWKKFQCKI